FQSMKKHGPAPCGTKQVGNAAGPAAAMVMMFSPRQIELEYGLHSFAVEPTRNAQHFQPGVGNMLDRVTGMRAFVRAAAAGSLSAAARQMDMSPAMATKHIDALEARLGVKLFHRTTRRLSLT